MPSKCSIVGCGALKSRNKPDLTFHRLPRNEDKKLIWLEAIGKENLRTNTKEIFICSLHFKENSFNRTLDILRLREDAVPSLFLKKNQENINIFGTCKCCLQDGFFKSLWNEYVWMGEDEIYGNMISECFALNWKPPEDLSSNTELICETCVTRLRDAFNFKKQVLSADCQFIIFECSAVAECQKPECDEDLVLEDNMVKYDEPFESYVEVLDETVSDSEMLEDFTPYNEEIEADDEAVQYNMVEKHGKSVNRENIVGYQKTDTKATSKESLIENNSQDQFIDSMELGEFIKILVTDDIKCKSFSNNDLKQCLEDIITGKLSKSEASKAYNISTQIIAHQLKTVANLEKLLTPSKPKVLKNDKLIEEIAAILTHTNATPFKTLNTKLYCPYCNVEFKDPEELRRHSKEQHFNERIKDVKKIMTPSSLNEVCKLDIENLQCTACCIPLNRWQDVFVHIKTKHKADLVESYSKIIPFTLQPDVIDCVICKHTFPNFALIDEHMNRHFKNYICADCGAPFLSFNRYKHHSSIHKIGSYPCEVCGKVFPLGRSLKKHIELVHDKKKNLKCRYCSESFTGEYSRHAHYLEAHPEKVNRFTCEYCGKSFDWRPFYLAHVRRDHLKERKYKCKECSMKFFLSCELKRHMVTHTNIKDFECDVCQKAFGTQWLLTQHSRVHNKNMRVTQRSRRNVTYKRLKDEHYI